MSRRKSGTTVAGGVAGEQALTVSQLTAQIDAALRDGLPPSLLVQGEVSNFKRHTASGHLYFTLKDNNACIDCVMFKSDAVRVKFIPSDGMELLVSGRIGIFAQRGRYQLYVSRIEPRGQGALELAFRQLCQKLSAEGLFDPGRKRPLPRYPRCIVLVTSTGTAALQDMLKVLGRFPWVRVLVYHVPVQGEGAGARIAAAIEHLSRQADAFGGIDLLLVGRGGGSLEDLWAFNEEPVARAIVACSIPVITGVGHEVDVSVADLAADYHAHTPTEAAQVATAGWRTARELLESTGLRLRREMRLALNATRQRLGQIRQHGMFVRPTERVDRLRQYLDDRQRALDLGVRSRLHRLAARLHRAAGRLEQNRPAVVVHRQRMKLGEARQRLDVAIGRQLARQRRGLGELAAALRERHPRHAIRLSAQHIVELRHRLKRASDGVLLLQRRALAALEAQLRALGPEQVLSRGYSITTLKRGGAVVRSQQQVRVGDRLVTRLADGTIESVAEDQHQLKLFE